MNDLLQLKQHDTKINFNELKASSAVNCINQIDECQATEKILKENHKRSSISACEQINAKRIKSHNNVNTIAPQNHSSNATIKSRFNEQMRNMNRDIMRCSSPPRKISSSPSEHQQNQQQSNSVLMNLLVNGCDVSAGYYTIPIPRQKAAKA